MRLRDAIVKSIKFAWKGKQRSPTRCVRFLPSQNGNRSALYATDGPQGILIFLDQGVDVPNTMVEAEKLSAAIKGLKEVTIEASANETLNLSGVTIDGGNVNEFPTIPTLPGRDFHPLPDWWVIEKLLHAVSKDMQQPLLQCLHFRKDLVEATDRFRVARTFVKTPWEGLVPAKTFANLPSGEMSATFGEDLAVFRIMDELRFTVLKRGQFQDCDQLLPPKHEGSRAITSRTELSNAIKRVKALATACKITLSPHAIAIEGGGFSETVENTQAHFSTNGAPNTTLHVNASWMHEALHHVSTPRVLLGYTDPGDPLRIESGPYVVGLWPFQGG